MAERSKSIPTKDFNQGFYMELECFMCGSEITIAADKKKWLSEAIQTAGWKILDSDEAQCRGYWCGCKY